MRGLSYIVALATTVAILNGLGLLSMITFAEAKQYLDNQEIYDTAKSLESAALLQDDVSSETIQKRIISLYNFARPPKSTYAKSQIENVLKVTNEYKFKAYEYAHDNKKGNKNWFSNIKNTLGPILPMRSLSKKNPFLQDLTQHYENESKKGLLNNDDIDCDLSRFKLSELYKISFVLNVDIKNLLMADQELINRAIFEQLQADKFSSPHNFHEVNSLNNVQRALLKEYYQNHMNLLVASVGNSVDHFYNPGEFIIGRLLDSCQRILENFTLWQELEMEREKSCSKSKINYNGKQFDQFHMLDQDNLNFCRGVFASM